MLPGICIICRNPVVYASKRWRDPYLRGKGKPHVCPVDRPTCGAWMRNARERCARAPGHANDHRTRWAMDNARAMATGRRVA